MIAFLASYKALMNYLHVGKIHSAQGIRGDVFVFLFAKEAAWEGQWQTLSLSASSETEPDSHFKILKKKSHFKQHKPGFVLTLEGVTTCNQAEDLIGMNVYVPESFLTTEDGEKPFMREVLGFDVIDVNRGWVGKVAGFSGNNLQYLVVIETQDGETFEVPFVSPIYCETHRDKKEVVFDIPHGLLPGEGF